MGAWVAGVVGLGIDAAIAWVIARSRCRAELACVEDPNDRGKSRLIDGNFGRYGCWQVRDLCF